MPTNEELRTAAELIVANVEPLCPDCRFSLDCDGVCVKCGTTQPRSGCVESLPDDRLDIDQSAIVLARHYLSQPQPANVAVCDDFDPRTGGAFRVEPQPATDEQIAELKRLCESLIAGPHVQGHKKLVIALTNEHMVALSMVLHELIPALIARLERAEAECGIDDLLIEHETRILPNGTTFQRHRCLVCSSYWDTRHPNQVVHPDELEGHKKDCRGVLLTARCRSLIARVEQLTAELRDIHETHKAIVTEDCNPVEKHCSCVPALRAENERLRSIVVRCRRVVEDAYLMDEALMRHAPLPPESQAAHDTGEWASESLLRDIDAAIDAARKETT